jgi:hypothetical protein
VVRSDQRHEKRSQKSKTLNYSGSVDSLWVCALEGTGADVFRVSPSGGVFVVFVVVFFFFFCVVSRRKREWKRPQDRDDDSCREREREDKMEGSKMGSDSGHT